MSRFNALFRFFGVNPANTAHNSHPFKAGTINQPIFNMSMLRNFRKDIPGAVLFSVIFAGYFTLWPYGIKKFHYFVNDLPVDTPQVTLDHGKAVVNIPTEHVKLDQSDDDE